MSRILPVARVLALVFVTLACAATLRTASVRVDGTRYFFLDDDQMISMRYARNLAEGHGLVWNPGERVEGYTNPGWTLVMAALHLLPLPDAKMPAAVKVTSWLLACWILLLAERLTRAVVPRDDLAIVFVLLTLSLSHDLLVWAANGFDTTLLTAVALFAAVRLVEERDNGPRVLTYVALGLLPIVRSDAFYVWAGVAALGWGLSSHRRAVLPWLACSLALPAIHLLARHAYYGAWLPNTFYVKVAGVHGQLASGLAYLKGYAAEYSVLLLVGGAGLWAGRARGLPWLAAPIVAGLCYIPIVGADMYPGTRFLAYTLPLLLVCAAVGVEALCREAPAARGVVLGALGTGVVFAAGVNGPSQFFALASGNGMPVQSLVAALTIEKNTAPDATIAVVAAGVAPYFSRRPALDLMGLTDARIARTSAHPGAPIGHAKYDVDDTLGRHPDVVLALFSVDERAADTGWADRSTAIRTNAIFVSEYAQHPLEIPSPAGPSWIYIRGGSTSAPDPRAWSAVHAER